VTLRQLHVVLVHPRDPLNLGAVARAMKNCELTRLTLVAPSEPDLVTARRVAVHAEELLAAPRRVTTLSEAVAGSVWVVGTTSRTLAGRPVLSPREVARQALLVARGGGEVALVFGGEQSGLSNEDLTRCHALSSIPSGREQPSFNLAQAVMLYAYELLVAARDADETAPVAQLERATDGEIAAVEEALRALLTASGFADPDRARHGVLELVQPLRRGALTSAEARLWLAALKAPLNGRGRS
jgi:TrmH family RNA methyltransferase